MLYKIVIFLILFYPNQGKSRSIFPLLRYLRGFISGKIIVEIG